MHFTEKLFLKDLRLTGKIVLTFFSGLAILVFVIHGLIVLGFDFPLDYGEGPLLNQALRITQGEPLYPADITSPPYLITNYPPIFVLLNAFFIWIFGPSLFIGRFIAFLATIGSAIIIAYLIKGFYSHQGYLPALMGASLFLSIPYVLQWSALFRIDMLALFFSLAGLFVVIQQPKGNKSVILAGVLFLLAAFTRQSFGLAGPLAAIIWLWHKERKQASKLLLFYAVGGLLIFGLLQLLSNGGFFFHIITANVNPFNWQTVINFARDLYTKMPWVLLIVITYLAVGWRYSPSYVFLAPFIIASSAVALTIGKIGSNVNYLVEISAAFAITSGLVFGKLWTLFSIDKDQEPDLDFPKDKIPPQESIHPGIKRSMWANLIIALLLTTILVIQLAGLTRESLLGPIGDHRNRIKIDIAYDILEKSIKVASIVGPVLADEYMAILPNNQIPVYIQPFEITQLANANLWDQTAFIDAVREQAFPLILMHNFQHYPVYLERWSPQMLQAIFDNYVANNFRADSLFFEPKDNESHLYPISRQCLEVPWDIPTEAHMGMFWFNRQLLMMGAGHSGVIPVYAIADGLLYQFPGWETSVAIQHTDPFEPGKKVWSYYGDLAPAFDAEHAHILDRFRGAQGEPINAGDLIGYQGNWLTSAQHTWVHLRFALLPGDANGDFPMSLLPINDFFAPLPSLQDQKNMGLDVPISLTAYTGLPQSNIFGSLVFLPYQCETVGE